MLRLVESEEVLLMASLWFLNIAMFAASGNRPLFKIKGNSNSMLSACSILYS
jgi:hypothetical protein